MTDLVPLFPRQPVPPLNVSLADGGSLDLEKEEPANFTLLVFYRGLHCPICKTQLREIESKLDEFDKRGVAVVAVSSDTKERAAQTREAWGLTRLRLGYGLDLASARRWGLFISTGRGMTSTGVEEPARFSEPALYLIPAGRHSVFRQRSDHAVRAPAFFRYSCRDRLCAEDQLSGPGRGAGVVKRRTARLDG